MFSVLVLGNEKNAPCSSINRRIIRRVSSISEDFKHGFARLPRTIAKGTSVGTTSRFSNFNSGRPRGSPGLLYLLPREKSSPHLFLYLYEYLHFKPEKRKLQLCQLCSTRQYLLGLSWLRRARSAWLRQARAFAAPMPPQQLKDAVTHTDLEVLELLHFRTEI